EETIAKWNKEHPRARVGKIPAGTYPGVDVEGKFYALYALMTTNSKVDPKIIEDVVKAIYDHSTDIAAVHPAGAQINKDNLIDYVKEGIIDPKYIHEGTLMYYKSIGNPISSGN